MIIEIRRKIFLIVFTFGFMNVVTAQQNYFTTLSASKKLSRSEDWYSTITGHWKIFYSDEGWNRIGVDGKVQRELGAWKVLGGLVTNYTFDQSIENNLEIRPFLGIGLHTPVFQELYLEQVLKFELRNFFFSEQSGTKSSSRAQYKLKPFYNIGVKWELFASYTWYYLQNEEVPIRFLSSRELTLGVSRFYSKNTLTISYARERFAPLNIKPNVSAHTFKLFFQF